jgi:hypothetical protein
MLIGSSNANPISKATKGIKYVTLLANSMDEFEISFVKSTTANAVPMTLKIAIKLNP